MDKKKVVAHLIQVRRTDCKRGGAQMFVTVRAIAHSHLGEEGGHDPPENFEILDSLRILLKHSEGQFELIYS